MSSTRIAPELKVNYWIDENGNETTKKYKIADNLGKFQILFFYQHNCPGCHLTGFPTIQKFVSEFGTEKVQFYVVETTFEDFSNNSKDKLIIDQKKYDLKVPFGFDSGESLQDNLPVTMKEYKTGGTPWIVSVNPKGEIIFADFRVNEEELIKYIKQNS